MCSVQSQSEASNSNNWPMTGPGPRWRPLARMSCPRPTTPWPGACPWSAAGCAATWSTSAARRTRSALHYQHRGHMLSEANEFVQSFTFTPLCSLSILSVLLLDKFSLTSDYICYQFLAMRMNVNDDVCSMLSSAHSATRPRPSETPRPGGNMCGVPATVSSSARAAARGSPVPGNKTQLAWSKYQNLLNCYHAQGHL